MPNELRQIARIAQHNVKDSIGSAPVINNEGSATCRPERYR